jgi:hypothetical protein
MNSQMGKESSSSIKVAFIGGLFVVLAAFISGVFLLLNTMLENRNAEVPPIVTQTQSLATAPVVTETQSPATAPIVITETQSLATIPVVSQPTSQILPSPTTDIINIIPTPIKTYMLIVTDITNNAVHGFNINDVTDSSKSCPGAYLETGNAQITYKIKTPSEGVIIIDSWQAEWEFGSYQNDGFLIITGEWEGTIKINTGAICGVPVEKAQTALQYRRNVTGNDGRPEYPLP